MCYLFQFCEGAIESCGLEEVSIKCLMCEGNLDSPTIDQFTAYFGLRLSPQVVVYGEARVVRPPG